MPDHRFFRGFGFATTEQFLDIETCAGLRAQALSARLVSARVGLGAEIRVDEDIRRTKVAAMPREAVNAIQERLLCHKHRFEDHFGITIRGCMGTEMLIYREGDFFQYHQDRYGLPDEPDNVKDRKLSVVIFLNGESDTPSPDCHGGGSLTFYGLMDFPDGWKYGFPLVAETGLMVAFRPEVPHEVTPVTHGERCTIVSWLV